LAGTIGFGDGSASRRRPTRCHRTTRANIRSHLYGGPQGWNPHFLRTYSYASEGYKPFVLASVRVARVGEADLAFVAFNPSALYHLRASDRPSPDSPGVGAFAFRSKCPGILKGIERGPGPDEVGHRAASHHSRTGGHS